MFVFDFTPEDKVFRIDAFYCIGCYPVMAGLAHICRGSPVAQPLSLKAFTIYRFNLVA